MNTMEEVWNIFLQTLRNNNEICSVERKMYVGQYFVYITCNSSLSIQQLNESIQQAAAKAMKGKRLTLSIRYVRKHKAFHIYTVRFFVPLRKMFCCGNLCHDCIRFNEN
ncbi:hypothetical protein [Salirhabdus salicampi]|uniref:hypothetical protein n=1 Tax=Salirhabdus salicampi TaxID=476102 RepID=UPI0020C5172D|nr:hypothetical protein [Salirhabdus salicampi]MCP8616630.1 hypothetical protein [Salirhabdus salicampi]